MPHSWYPVSLGGNITSQLADRYWQSPGTDSSIIGRIPRERHHRPITTPIPEPWQVLQAAPESRHDLGPADPRQGLRGQLSAIILIGGPALLPLRTNHTPSYIRYHCILTRREADSLISTRFLHDRVSGIFNLTTQTVHEDDRARTTVSTSELFAPLDST